MNQLHPAAPRGPRVSFLASATVVFASALAAQSPADPIHAMGLRGGFALRVATAEAAGGDTIVALEQGTILRLRRHTVRATGFRLLAVGADGIPTELDPGPVVTVRGTVEGLPGSSVAGSVSSGHASLRIALSDGSDLWLQPVAPHVPGAPPDLHVLYRDDDVAPLAAQCGSDLLAAAQDTSQPFGNPGGSLDGGILAAELACDADYEYFTRNGSSVLNASNRIQTILSTMNLQYERDVSLTHAVTNILVRTSATQPYTSTDPYTLLDQFRAEWNANQSGIVRDVAHLFTGKALDGSVIGIAWLGVVCSSRTSGYGYGLVEYYSSTLATWTDLSAHELGHNWNATHCSCPSYTMNPYITSTNVFDPATSIPEISGFAASRSCLSASAPPAPPSGLVASAVSGSEVQLAWSDNSTDESGFTVEQSTDGVNFVAVRTTAADATSATVSGLAAVTTYHFRVFSSNSAGNSAASNVATATTLAAPPVAPSALVAAGDIGLVRLSWNDNSADESGFELERSMNGSTWSQLATVAADVRAYEDTGLLGGSTWWYRVRATSPNGPSTWSNSASARVLNVPQDIFAASELSVLGDLVTGSRADTLLADGVAEVLTERQYTSGSGRKVTSVNQLEHQWTFGSVPATGIRTLRVTCRQVDAADTDAFAFEYRTVNRNGKVSWTRMFTVTAADWTEATFVLPTNVSGTVVVRVVDTNRTNGASGLDSVEVDRLAVSVQ